MNNKYSASRREFWSAMSDAERLDFVAGRAARAASVQRRVMPTYSRLPLGITEEQHAADLALLARCKAEYGL